MNTGPEVDAPRAPARQRALPALVRAADPLDQDPEPHVASGVAAGPTVIPAADTITSPLKIHSPGSNLADGALLELTANGELILADGSGNGYRFTELGPANNPSGWSGVLKVKTPAGVILASIVLYSNP